MRSRLLIFPLLALVGALALAGCGANPPAQAEPAPPSGIVLPTPPPMPTDPPRPPTPTPLPAPTGAAAPAAAPLLSASFDQPTDLRGWTVLDAADALPGPTVWAVSNGRLSPVSDAQDSLGLYGSALVTGDPQWTDYAVSVAAYVSTNDEVGVVARGDAAGYYVFKLLPAGQQPGLVLARYRADNHAFEPLATAAGGFAPRHWYTLRLEVRGAKLTAYLDGRAVLSAQDTSYAR